MEKFFKIKNLDFLGFLASALCAVHCTVVPLVFSIGLIDLGDLHHNHLFDVLIVGAGMVIASSSIIKDYFKNRIKAPLFLCLVGIGALVMGLFGHESSHQFSSILGGLALAFSHLLNWKLNHKDC